MVPPPPSHQENYGCVKIQHPCGLSRSILKLLAGSHHALFRRLRPIVLLILNEANALLKPCAVVYAAVLAWPDDGVLWLMPRGVLRFVPPTIVLGPPFLLRSQWIVEMRCRPMVTLGEGLRFLVANENPELGSVKLGLRRRMMDNVVVACCCCCCKEDFEKN